MLSIFFSSLLSSFFFISGGYILLKYIYKNDDNFNSYKTISAAGLWGIILLSFFALLINFIINLGQTLNTLIMLVSISIFILTTDKKIKKKTFLVSLSCAIISTVLLYKSQVYRPDAGLYHLPFISILNNDKIIIGLSNLHFRFGHTSIFQYISAINNNLFFNDNGILIPGALIFSFFFLFSLKEFLDSKNNINKIFYTFILIFLCLRFNRYSEYGNDSPAHIYFLFLICLFVNDSKKFKLNDLEKKIVLSVYIFFSKITLIIALLFPLFYAYHYKVKLIDLCKINFKTFLFITLFSIIFLAKNILNTGCLFFPVEQTCSSNIYWYDTSEKRSSNAKVTMYENEAWTKGWPDQNPPGKNFKEYLSDWNWIKTWGPNHGIQTLKKLLPTLFFLLFYILLLFIFSKSKKNRCYNINNNNKKKFKIILFSSFVGIIIWFIKFPVLRYGFSYFIIFFIFLIILVFNKLLNNLSFHLLKKISNNFILLAFLIFLSLNLLRMYNKKDSNYINSPWPKIYSETDNNDKNPGKAYFKGNDLILYKPEIYPLCYYNNSPCTHDINVQFTIDEIRFKKKYGYKIYFFGQ